QIKSAGRTVVLSTHYIDEAHQLCDRIAIIDRGRVVAVGQPDELVAASKTPARIVIRTSKPLDASRLREIVPSSVLREHAGEWHISSNEVTRTVTAIVSMVDGNELLDLQIHRPTLEDVYLELTGTPFGPSE
ncbi:MAG TPA: hypothetical protein VLI90_17305, partial [Tepidisphaeraceae bacterium]|nr:hypothetical protein [Tepidisphaeraceae bacterium]